MRQKARTGPRLFFIEFIIVLFFFLIISTVCLRLFVRSHRITQDANALSGSASTAASIAAVLKSNNGSVESLSGFFPEGESASDGFRLYFDRDFLLCGSESFYYYVTTEILSGQDLSADMDFPAALPSDVDSGTDPLSDTGSCQDLSFLIRSFDCDGNLVYQLPVLIHCSITRGEVLQ